MFLGLVAVSAVFRPAMPKVAMYIVVAVLAHLGASSFALADERTLNVGCYFSGENMVSLDIALTQKKELPSDNVLDLLPSDNVLDLIVSGVDLEVHSEVGGFWIQLEQPVLPNLTFDLCEILQSAAIKPEETDAGRFLVQGKASGIGEPVDLRGRCSNFPIPPCEPSE
jgi:hypothetical protein